MQTGQKCAVFFLLRRNPIHFLRTSCANTTSNKKKSAAGAVAPAAAPAGAGNEKAIGAGLSTPNLAWSLALLPTHHPSSPQAKPSHAKLLRHQQTPTASTTLVFEPAYLVLWIEQQMENI